MARLLLFPRLMPNAVKLISANTPVPSTVAGTVSTHITLRGLTKSFGGQLLYDKFDLDLPRGKVSSFFGPNGCGKSTLINMICGLIRPDAGEVLFDGKTRRETVIGYVFQNYREALFPWKALRIDSSICRFQMLFGQ